MAVEIKEIIGKMNSSSKVEYKDGAGLLTITLKYLERQGQIPYSLDSLKEEELAVQNEILTNSGGRYRISEAARRLGMSTRMLRHYANKGLIAHSRLPGGHRLFPESAIEEFRRKMAEANENPSVWVQKA